MCFPGAVEATLYKISGLTPNTNVLKLKIGEIYELPYPHT